MRHLVRDERGVARRSTRGVAFMWTILVAMPLMFFGLSMAVDFTRIIMAGREMRTATHAAALAGAYQFTPGKATLNAVAANDAAVETMCVTVDQGAIKNAVPGDSVVTPCSSGQAVSVTTKLLTTSTIQVTARYRVDDLLLVKYFDYGQQEHVVSRTAAVCDPSDTSGPTNGFCTRPTN